MPITARSILNAIEGGDIESIRDDGMLTVLIDRKPALTIPNRPAPKIQVTGEHAVQVLSGDRVDCSIEEEDAFDAKQIADALKFMVKVAK